MYSPDDAVVTPIVAKAREIFGFPMADIMGKSSVSDEIALSDEGRELLDRIRHGEIESLEQGSRLGNHGADGRAGCSIRLRHSNTRASRNCSWCFGM